LVTEKRNMLLVGYLLLLLAGALVANAIPHLAAGLRGEPFPTPFASPPGKGLSAPVVNALWGSANLLIGVYIGDHRLPDVQHGLAFAALGFVATAVGTAWHFGRVRNAS
jgi:hypothetical protein